MKKQNLLPVVLLFISLNLMWGQNKTDTSEAVESKDMQTITDMAGRTVEIPSSVHKVFATMPIGTHLLYTVDPTVICGLNWEPTEYEKEYLTKEYCSLPVLRGWYSTYSGNVEEIIKTAPDFILATARKDPKKVPSFSEQADRIQNQLNIPVILIDTRISKLGDAYRFLGKILKREDRSEALAEYTGNLLADVKKKAALIPENNRLRVYYAEGKDGLTTDLSGSAHSEIISLTGAVNVAVFSKSSKIQGNGMAKVSPEQLLQWDPQVIIAAHNQGFAGNAAPYNKIKIDSRFTSLSAVKENKIYEIPYKPFDVTTKPPAENRLLGMLWLGNLLYPDVYNYDIKDEFKKFYQLFYRINLTDSDINSILENSER